MCVSRAADGVRAISFRSARHNVKWWSVDVLTWKMSVSWLFLVITENLEKDWNQVEALSVANCILLVLNRNIETTKCLEKIVWQFSHRAGEWQQWQKHKHKHFHLMRWARNNRNIFQKMITRCKWFIVMKPGHVTRISDVQTNIYQRPVSKPFAWK